MNKKMCEVCSQNEQKYRCPKCKIVYCSLNCFKTHKGIIQISLCFHSDRDSLFANFKKHAQKNQLLKRQLKIKMKN